MTLFAPEGTERVYDEWTVVRGESFRTKLTLYSDERKREKQNLEGYICTLVLDDWITLSEGAGLTLVQKAGEIFVVLTSAQTAACPVDQIGFYLEVEESEGKGESDSPYYGVASFTQPQGVA